MAQRTVRINTLKYEATHGRKPRQPREYHTSPWAFQIDNDTTPVFLTGRYCDVLKQAQKLAQYVVTVLP